MSYSDYLEAANLDIYTDCYDDADNIQRDLRRFNAIARENASSEKE